MRGAELITVSRRRQVSECPYAAKVMYEHGIRPIQEASYFRFGGIIHEALDIYAKTNDDQQAFEAIYQNYADRPEHIDEYEWRIEEQKVLQLFSGYIWRWQEDQTVVLESEKSFSLPIINPETGKPTPLFRSAGKRDKKIKQPNGRIGIREHKTTGDDISPESEYWDVLRVDLQVSTYFASYPDCEFIEYDVIRKPTIRPLAVPLTDDDGVKIVLDSNGQRVRTKDGKKWRESASSADGYTLQTRPESPEEYGERLSKDITERPDFYYARREIPRLSADMQMFHVELWDFQRSLRWRQMNNCWPRQPNQYRCGFCPIKRPCFNGFNPETDPIPEGFEQIEFVHPELTEGEIVNV